LSLVERNEAMVVVRLKGGLGNQLFMYAAARRLSLKNNVPLLLDVTSGFQNDYFLRNYRLNHFNIKAETASPYQSFNGILGRVRRQILRMISKCYKFDHRLYLDEKSRQFDVRLLNLEVNGIIFLEGYWASEKYFKDIEGSIRDDLRIVAKHDAENLAMAEKIQSTNSVCLHVRRLRGLPSTTDAKSDPSIPSLDIDYYKKGIEIIAGKISEPVFYCFGDHPQWFIDNIKIDYPITVIDYNKYEKDYEDLWLMSLCKHFIIANSTFSWWGAWLSNHNDKIVIVPDANIYHNISGINIFNRDNIPSGWLTI
jgi:hypothetical protein